MRRQMIEWKSVVGTVVAACAAVAFTVPVPVTAQESPSSEVTFNKDIAPILQRSCQQCHRPGGVAPMALVSYEDALPYAMRMMRRTGSRDRQGPMPPWYIEKDIGIQHFKDDPSPNRAAVAAGMRCASERLHPIPVPHHNPSRCLATILRWISFEPP